MVFVNFICALIVTVILVILAVMLLKKLHLHKSFKILLSLCIVVFSFTGMSFVLGCENNVFTNSDALYDSPKEALEACTKFEEINTIVEVDGGAFLICNTNNPMFGTSDSSEVVHTILCRNEGKWSAVDLYNNVDEGGIIRISEQSNFYGSGTLTYNSELNKSLIKLRLFINGTDNDEESFEIKDKDGNTFTNYGLSTNTETGVHNYSCYLVIDGKMKDGFEVIINGLETNLYCNM